MEQVLGIDVDSEKLVSCIVVDGKRRNAKWRTFENKESDFADLPRYLQDHQISRVVMEATGGYEKKVSCFLRLGGIEVHVIKPKQGRDFANGLNILAKNDAIDAFVLGRLGQVAEFPTAPKINETQLKIKPLTMRRSQLKEMVTEEKNRLRLTDGSVKESIEIHIQFLEEQIAKLEEEVDNCIEGDEELKNIQKILIKTKGYGKTTAAVILALLPEIGRISNKAVAALAGLAPMADDSGKHKGKRKIKGGRWHLRKALYMPAYSSIAHDPEIKVFHQRLIDKGKVKKVATVAVMRKVLVRANATVRNYLRRQE